MNYYLCEKWLEIDQHSYLKIRGSTFERKELRHETIEVLVIGSMGVGKTRLICYQTCGSVLGIGQMLERNLPTNWAKSCMKKKSVLRRTCLVVDGVRVVLRIHDAVATQELERRDLYATADVIMICFSIKDRRSFESCETIWYPEIRKYCQKVPPIVIVGCKNDVRFLFKDEDFVAKYLQKVKREIKARQKLIKAILEETSSSSNDPPEKKLVTVDVLNSTGVPLEENKTQDGAKKSAKDKSQKEIKKDQAEMTISFLESFITREEGRNFAHSINAFYYETSVHTTYGVSCVFENASRAALINIRKNRIFSKGLRKVKYPELQRPYLEPQPEEPGVSCLSSTYAADMNSLFEKGVECDIILYVNDVDFPAHRLFLSASSPYFHELFFSSYITQKLQVLNLTSFHSISSYAFECLLRFMYSGKITIVPGPTFEEIKQALENCEVKHLKDALVTTVDSDQILNRACIDKYQAGLKSQLLETYIHTPHLYSDIIFNVDDGKCYAHRAILMGRSKFFATMFNGKFIDSNAKEIHFPGTTKFAFDVCMFYLYSDKLHFEVNTENFDGVLCLADRLGLVRLITLIEWRIVKSMKKSIMDGLDISKFTLKVLRVSEIHNAVQLANWSQYYLRINYEHVTSLIPDLLEKLDEKFKDYLENSKWPPNDYHKEMAYYEQHVHDLQKHRGIKMWKATKHLASNIVKKLKRRGPATRNPE